MALFTVMLVLYYGEVNTKRILIKKWVIDRLMEISELELEAALCVMTLEVEKEYPDHRVVVLSHSISG